MSGILTGSHLYILQNLSEDYPPYSILAKYSIALTQAVNDFVRNVQPKVDAVGEFTPPPSEVLGNIKQKSKMIFVVPGFYPNLSGLSDLAES